MRSTRWLWPVVGVVCGIGATFLVTQRRAPASWQERVATAYLPPEARQKTNHLPATYWAMSERVSGDILRRQNWGASELEELRRYQSAPVDWKHVAGPAEQRTEAAAMAFLMWNEVMIAIALRLETKAPIEEPVRQALIADITKLLDHEAGLVRNTGIAHLTSLGLIDHPGPVRSKVESMRTDPDPEVAANAIRQLEWRDLLVKKGVVK